MSTTTLTQILPNMTYYVGLVTFIFGLIGSIGNFITLTGRQMRQSSASFYLSCVAASQFITILVCVSFRLFYDHSGSNLMREVAIFCKFRYYLAVTLPALVSYYMVLATLDRFFCTSDNIRIRTWSQIKTAKRLAPITFIVILTMSVHILILYDIYNNSCQINPRSIYKFIFAGFLITIVIFLPHVLMLIFSLLTIMALKKSRQRVIPATIGNRISNHRRTLELKLIKV